MKYTIDDLINQKIIISCSYIQGAMLARELEKKGIDTTLYYNYGLRVPVLYFNVENGKLIGQTGSETVMKEDGYEVIGFNELDINLEDIQIDDTFQLGEVVHAAIDERRREPFNNFANVEHITAIITRIDHKNKMCEIVYLYNKHKTLWVTFDELYHIESMEELHDD